MTHSKNHNFNLVWPCTRIGLKAIALMAISFFLYNCDDSDNHDMETWEMEVEQVRDASDKYHDFDNATEDGYEDEVTGYRSQMGFHYLNTAMLDDKIDLNHPELLLYVPDGKGGLKFVAVEYAVPIADMDHPQSAPEGFTGDKDAWEINTEFNLWTLHVWVGVDNPHGIFHPHNPDLP